MIISKHSYFHSSVSLFGSSFIGRLEIDKVTAVLCKNIYFILTYYSLICCINNFKLLKYIFY